MDVFSAMLSPCCRGPWQLVRRTVRCGVCHEDLGVRDGFFDLVGQRAPARGGLIQSLWESRPGAAVYGPLRTGIEAFVARRVTDSATEAILLKNFLDPRPEDAILNLGCGDGRHVACLLGSLPAASMACVDVSEPMLRAADRRIPAELRERCLLVRASGYDLPIEDESIDRAFSIAMLHLLRDPVPLLREVRRILRPGGVFVFTAFLKGAVTGHPAVSTAMARLLGVHFDTPRDVLEMVSEGGFREPEMAVLHPLAMVRVVR
jgi:ubiquinone/menaquinone biosynthesis C-methylase UbiE